MVNSAQYDIILIGAGLVGTSLVVALQNQGIKIAVLENHLPVVATQSKKDTRPLSLSYSSKVILQTLGIWPDLQDFACPIKTVHVSNEGAFGAIHFNATEQSVAALGYVVPFGDLQRSLYRHATAQSNVNIIPINELITIDCAAMGCAVKVNTAHGVKELTSSLVIAADGAHSSARQLLKIPTVYSNHGAVALTAQLDLRSEHNHCAFERFTHQGTLAILPMLKRKRCRFVWSMDKNMADDVAQWSDEKLITHLQNSFADRIPVIEKIKRGAQFPLQTIIAQEQIRSGFVLLGNAAHTLYPLAAQGFNLGLRDVAALAEVLVNARHDVKSCGDLSVLQNYFEWRESDQKRVAGLTSGISNLFGVRMPLLKSVRGLGLLATDLIMPLKKRLAKRLMGLSGRLPKLVRAIPLWEKQHDDKS